MVIYMFKSIASGWMIYLLHIAGQFHGHGPLHIELTVHRSNYIHIRMFFLCVNKRLINLTLWQLTLPIWGPRVQCDVRYTCPSYRIRFWIDRNGWQQLSSIDTGSVLTQDLANTTWPATIPGRSFCSPNGKNLIFVFRQGSIKPPLSDELVGVFMYRCTCNMRLILNNELALSWL